MVLNTSERDGVVEAFGKDGISHATINNHRFHLRTKDPVKENYLWIDGRLLLVLNRVAAEFAAAIINSMWQFGQGEGNASEKVKEFVVDEISKRYGGSMLPWRRVSRERIRKDLDVVFGTLMCIAENRCPVESGVDIKEVVIEKWAAPARMDLAVTYRCNLNCGHCYTWAGPNGKTKELETGEWEKVLERLWEIGVPNVVFTGGEPTLREDIIQLVAKAEQFVTGLVTNGTKLAGLAEGLREASLDYVQVTLESADGGIHNKMVGAEFDAFDATVNGIKKAIGLGMHVVTNTTLTEDSADGFLELIRFGKSIGLKNMACNTLICSGRGIGAKKAKGLEIERLKGILEEARKTAAAEGMNLDWFSPTCYKHLNPLELGFGAKGCSAAAYNMTVGPDGLVFPCQSWPEAVGNILTDKWDDIWNRPVCVKLREHGHVKEKQECRSCLHNEVCGGGCPLE